MPTTTVADQLTPEDCLSYLEQSYRHCENDFGPLGTARMLTQWADDFVPLLLDLFGNLNWLTAGQDEHLILNKIRQKLLTHWPLCAILPPELTPRRKGDTRH